MKFFISSTELLKTLQVVGGVISNNNTMPILDNFLFELSPNKLKVVASDLYTTICATLEVESEDTAKVAIPAKLLQDILKTFPEQPLTIYTKDDNLIEIVSDQGEYSIAYQDGQEYPQIEEVKEIAEVSINGNVIAEGISKALFATSNDDLRPIMTGVFFQFRADGCSFVSTDAHKLVKYSFNDNGFDQASEFVMPKKPLAILKSTLLGNDVEVKIEFNDKNAKFIYDNLEITCRLIDGKYPNYEAVIPKNNTNVLTISRTQLLNTAKRIALFANQTNHLIKFELQGSELKISAEDIDFSNKADERLLCDYKGDDLVIGFNSKFLVEMLNNLNSEEVRLEMQDSSRAGLLFPADGLEKGEEVLMLLMPLMVK